MPLSRSSRTDDPFRALTPALEAARRSPAPPVFFVASDDDWILQEARRRVVAAFRAGFPDSEVAEYDGTGNSVKEAIADAATIALFSTNRLVTLDASDLFRARRLTGEELDALLDEAGEAVSDRILARVARKARALLVAAGAVLSDDAADTAKKVCGRVKRADRAGELAALLAVSAEDQEPSEGALDRLLDYAARAERGENVLLVHAVSPDEEHPAFVLLKRQSLFVNLSLVDEGQKRERLCALGLERAVERNVSVDPEVFDTLVERGRLAARPFLSEVDRLIQSAAGNRITLEAAARLVVDERKEYGSDFVELVAARRPLDALSVLERLLAGQEFTAFRPSFKDAGAPPRKGPRGESAFFPLLGLLAGEIRRMLCLKAASAALGKMPSRRPDYRAFAEQVLPALRDPRRQPAVPLDGHPFVLHKSYLASLSWSMGELIEALKGIEAVDRGVKTGIGTGRELLEAFLLARVEPRVAARR